MSTVPVPRRVYIRKNVELARWCNAAGCSGCIVAQTGASRDHSEEWVHAMKIETLAQV